MKPQKILLNGCMYSKNPPGVGVNTREAYNALTARLNSNELDYQFFTYAKQGLKEPEKVSLIKLPLFLELLFKRFVSFHRLIWNIFFLPVIAKKYDLVYSFTSHGSPFIKNQIITIHDLICFQYPEQNKFQYIYFKYILPSIIKSCKKIVVISEFTKQDVIKHYKVNPDKLVVIYCGHDHLKDLDTSTEKADLEELESLTGGQSFFLTVGASLAHKNVDKIIEAMQAVPGYLLLVTGPNNSYYSQLKLSTKKKNYKNIIFLNYVSDSFLKMLYKNCVANVYLSSYEGFGSTPLEAAMSNKISVVADKSVLPEIYGDSVMYVNPENIAEVKKTFTSVVSLDFNDIVFKDKFPDLIKKYNWANMADGIIKEIMSGLDGFQKTIKPNNIHSLN